MDKVSREASSEARVIRTRKRGFPHEGWQWEGVVADFEEALLSEGLAPVGSPNASPVTDALGRIAARMGRPVHSREPITFAALMGTKPRLLFPHGYRGALALYLWDVWPEDTERWRHVFDQFQPIKVYFSCRSAAEHWERELPQISAEWLPEAITPHAYARGALPLRDRIVDVLELGRPFRDFHDRIAPRLASLGLAHQYPTPERPFLFATREELIAGVRDAKVLVCFPGSITDPLGRTGGWETMTYRYLEAVAARTLIIGRIPDEMRDLFGYTPGLNVDLSADPAGQIVEVLDNIDQYQDLVDEAASTLEQVATWEIRARHIVRALATGCDTRS